MPEGSEEWRDVTPQSESDRSFLARPASIEKIVGGVEALRGEPIAVFALRQSDWGLPMVLCLARMHSGLTLDAIGGLDGGMGYKTVYTRIQRFKVRLETDSELKRMTEQCKKEVKNGET